jgi:hypothetical protein
MTRWLLNSAVLAAGGYGTYRYEAATVADLASYLREPGWVSRVGYAETAEQIRRWAGVTVPLSRESSPMAEGDVAMVVRLRYRIAQPGQKGSPTGARETDWEVGRLTRLPERSTP